MSASATTQAEMPPRKAAIKSPARRDEGLPPRPARPAHGEAHPVQELSINPLKSINISCVPGPPDGGHRPSAADHVGRPAQATTEVPDQCTQTVTEDRSPSPRGTRNRTKRKASAPHTRTLSPRAQVAFVPPPDPGLVIYTGVPPCEPRRARSMSVHHRGS